jgi:Nucleoporin complex subunit 54
MPCFTPSFTSPSNIFGNTGTSTSTSTTQTMKQAATFGGQKGLLQPEPATQPTPYSSLGLTSASASALPVRVMYQSTTTSTSVAAKAAHYHAWMEKEDRRVLSHLNKLMNEYNCTVVVPHGVDYAPSARFVCIVYNELTPQQRHRQWELSSRRTHTSYPLAVTTTTLIDQPERPSQISNRDWMEALMNNPDPLNYIPHAIIGVQALKARRLWQQEQAEKSTKCATELISIVQFIQRRFLLTKQKLEESLLVHHTTLRNRLVSVMKKVEMARGCGNPLQMDEVRIRQHLNYLMDQVEKISIIYKSLCQKLDVLQVSGRSNVRRHTTDATSLARRAKSEEWTPQKSKNLLEILTCQQRKLDSLSVHAKAGNKDVNLIGSRVSTLTR